MLNKNLNPRTKNFIRILNEEKKEKLWLSPRTKAPTPAEMSKGQSDNANNATKSSSTQRLRTDLRRSVGVTTAPKWCG